MKKISKTFVIILIFTLLTSCADSKDREGQAKTPGSASMYKGEDYKTVENDFKNQGFTNIVFEVKEDLIIGWLTKEGEVESILVDGDNNFSEGVWHNTDVEILITYHAFPSKEETVDSSTPNDEKENDASTNEKDPQDKNAQDDETSQENEDNQVLTVENNNDLKNLFSRQVDDGLSYTEFSDKYGGREIEFDGRIDLIDNNITYNPFTGKSKVNKTLFDVLFSYGDYDPETQIGPTMRVKALRVSQLQRSDGKGSLNTGSNVRVKLRFDRYDENRDIFEMSFVSITER